MTSAKALGKDVNTTITTTTIAATTTTTATITTTQRITVTIPVVRVTILAEEDVASVASLDVVDKH